MSRGWRLTFVVAILAAGLLVAGIAPASAELDIGRVRAGVMAAYGTPPAESRQTLFARDRVFTDEVLETAWKSALHIRFRDKSVFQLGASSRATLDRFVYDPDSRSGKLTLNLKEGIFRIKTGKMKKEGIRVVTPVAVISVVGTDFIVQVLASGIIRVAVLEGRITISPSVAGAPQTTLEAPSRASFDGDGAVTPGGYPDRDPGMDDMTRRRANTGGGDSGGGGEGGR